MINIFAAAITNPLYGVADDVFEAVDCVLRLRKSSTSTWTYFAIPGRQITKDFFAINSSK